MHARQASYGLIVIDGGEATIGIASLSSTGVDVSNLAHISGNIASRTRRGGQSALRYSRLRDGAELAFLRRVAEKAVEHHSDLHGVLIGGKAEMKRKLVFELPLMLRSRVACVVGLACGAGLEGLQQLSFRLHEVHEKEKLHGREKMVCRFLELVDQSDVHGVPIICYGEEQTIAAMRLGAVEHLLVASSLCPRESSRWVTFKELAITTGASVTEIDPRSSLEVRFCEGFQIGAYLRWPVDPELLDSATAENTCTFIESCAAQDEMESDVETVSTVASKSDNVLLQWLESALQHTLKDSSAAEALTTCTDLILSDESTTVEERLHNTTDMLRGEGVPEDLLAELSLHISDFLDIEQQ